MMVLLVIGWSSLSSIFWIDDANTSKTSSVRVPLEHNLQQAAEIIDSSAFRLRSRLNCLENYLTRRLGSYPFFVFPRFRIDWNLPGSGISLASRSSRLLLEPNNVALHLLRCGLFLAIDHSPGEPFLASLVFCAVTPPSNLFSHLPAD